MKQAFYFLTNKHILLATGAGGLSGVLAFFTHVELELTARGIPGLIFGLFVAAYSLYYTRTAYGRALVWCLASWLSFLAAFWSGLALFFAVSQKFSPLLLSPMFVHGVAGFVGCVVLLATARILFGAIHTKVTITLLVLASVVPFLLVPVFGMTTSGELLSIGIPSEPYYLVTMIVWQAVALATLVRGMSGITMQTGFVPLET